MAVKLVKRDQGIRRNLISRELIPASSRCASSLSRGKCGCLFFQFCGKHSQRKSTAKAIKYTRRINNARRRRLLLLLRLAVFHEDNSSERILYSTRSYRAELNIVLTLARFVLCPAIMHTSSARKLSISIDRFPLGDFTRGDKSSRVSFAARAPSFRYLISERKILMPGRESSGVC